MTNIMSVATKHGTRIAENPYRWVRIYVNYDNTVYMDIGIIRADGKREKPHATRQYYIHKGEVTFLTQVHC